MTREDYIKESLSDCSETLSSVSAYFAHLRLTDESLFSVSSRMNGEVPSKLESSRLTLIALTEERLSTRSQALLVGLSAKKRIRYYDLKLARCLASTLHFPAYSPWVPQLAHRLQQVGRLSACMGAVAALVAIFSAVRALALHHPLHAGIASVSALLFVAVVVISIIVALHPEKLPNVTVKEHQSAKAHLEQYLARIETVYMDFVSAAELSLCEQINLLSKESA